VRIGFAQPSPDLVVEPVDGSEPLGALLVPVPNLEFLPLLPKEFGEARRRVRPGGLKGASRVFLQVFRHGSCSWTAPASSGPPWRRRPSPISDTPEPPHEPPTEGPGIGPECAESGVGNLARLQLADGRAVDPRPLGQVGEAQTLTFA